MVVFVRMQCVSNLAGDLTRQIGDIEVFNTACSVLARRQALPCDLMAAAKWRNKTQTCDDDTSHRGFP